MEQLEQRHEQQERAKNTITTEHDSTKGKNRHDRSFLSFGRAEVNTS